MTPGHCDVGRAATSRLQHKPSQPAADPGEGKLLSAMVFPSSLPPTQYFTEKKADQQGTHLQADVGLL